MKKVVVTGGSGFIGSNLVKYLLKKKYFVINIDKLSYSANPYNTRNLKKNKKRVEKIINKKFYTDRNGDLAQAFLIKRKKLTQKSW